MNSRLTAKQKRAMLGEAAVLSVDHAAELLPWRTHEAREFLRQEHLIRSLRGHDFVIWADVLAVLRARTDEAPFADDPIAPVQTGRLRRKAGW